MEKLKFQVSEQPTLGIEIELALVDDSTMALANRAGEIIARVPTEYADSIKPELMQSYIEVNSSVCRTTAAAHRDLAEKMRVAEAIAGELGLRLYWSGTHPFSLWRDQEPTPNKRYLRLLDRLQDVGRQLVTFGLHVHVGVDSGDKAIMICDRIMRHLPLLLALSCNSPWWENRVTGLLSHRSKIMEALPTSGLPPLMRNWSEYVWLVKHLEDTRFIDSIRDIWWVVRPHHNFGTVEVRVCDVPGSLDDAMAIAALVHSLVRGLSTQIDEGAYQHDCHPMLVRQNMWHAERYGLDAELVDDTGFVTRPVRSLLNELMDKLEERHVDEAARPYFARLREMAKGPTWAERQLALLNESGKPDELIRRMTEDSALRRLA